MNEQEKDDLLAGCLLAARRLYERNEMNGLKKWCVECLSVFNREPEFFRLLAVAEGNLGDHLAARRALIQAIAIEPGPFDIANLATATFASGQTALALRIVGTFYQGLCGEAQRAMLSSLVESLRIGAVEMSDLTPIFRERVQNIRWFQAR